MQQITVLICVLCVGLYPQEICLVYGDYLLRLLILILILITHRLLVMVYCYWACIFCINSCNMSWQGLLIRSDKILCSLFIMKLTTKFVTPGNAN